MSTDSSPLRIALVGTRGVPAAYGGFETAVDEIGRRLAARGHDVTVYCRPTEGPRLRRYRGMRLVHLPALRVKALETLSHTALSVAHLITRARTAEAAIVFNSANAPFLPLLRLRRVPTAVHVDGLEWQRSKWSGAGRRYYRWAEGAAVRRADALIADAGGIADYYRHQFDADTRLIAYGAPLLHNVPADRLGELTLTPGGYHLVVARLEPENHVDLIVAAYRASGAQLPLVVVGAAPYAAAYTARIREIAGDDPRIRLVGAIHDQPLIDALYANAASYLHGHSVGGTNPSLLRALGAGAPTVAYDVVFNREVAGERARYAADVPGFTAAIEAIEADPTGSSSDGEALRERVRERYDWDEVADHYEQLARDLAAGRTSRVPGRGRRSPHDWQPALARETAGR